MKKTLVVSLSLMILLSLAVSLASAKYVATSKSQDVRYAEDYKGSQKVSMDQDLSRLPAAAPGDTYELANYTFDSGASCVANGWVKLDNTSQLADFFHVAQATGGVNNELTGGAYGLLVPLQGNKSLWCGAYSTHPTTPVGAMCGYIAMPGYGNDWNQAICTVQCLAVGTGVSITFLTTWDSEPGYDGTTVEVDECNGTWVPAGAVNSGGGQFDGTGVDSLHTTLVPDTLHSGSMRIRFHMAADGAWSDQDGLWDTDGAILIDSLSVSDNGGLVLGPEDFESVAEGATSTADWESCTPIGYGDFGGILQGFNLIQEDPCASEITCMWNFFTGSPANYACGGFPGQAAMPYGNADGQYLNQSIRSPLIQWAGNGAGAFATLRFRAYRDLALDNLQFYTWGVASNVAGCIGAFQDRNFVYYGGQKDWIQSDFPFGDLVSPGASDIQIQFGAVDMCGVWCGVYGTGACHSHAPLLDTVEVLRVEVVGPQWSIRDLDLFQDTFASDGTINATATGFANSANDINAAANPNINPGDSVTVRVSDPDFGLATDPFSGSGAAAYTYVAVWPQGQTAKEGDNLTQDIFRYPVVGSLTDANGTLWYCLRMDTSFTDGAARTGAQPDAFCIDLNDNLFTVGDTVCFMFAAESTSGKRTYWSPFTGSTDAFQDALDQPAEFQILPGGGYNAGGDILYVDGMNARGAQPFFDTAFEFLGIADQVDRYDIRAPSSGVANRPGARVQNVFQQIIAPYRKIIWNTGDLSIGLIGDGTGTPEKSNDAFVLFTFIDQKTNTGGIYFSGDDLADELYNKALPSVDLVNLRTYIQGAVGAGDNNANQAGFGTAPLGVGEPSSCFDHTLGPDQIVIFGGCPLINDFDVITPAGTSVLEMNYGGAPAQTRGAVISQTTTNTGGASVGVILAGFSFHYIRDAVPAGVPARVHHMEDILIWLNNTPTPPTGQKTSGTTYSLSQNYPNPFNPQTAIQFTVKEQAPVSLKIYNAAGQLVKTLVDDVRTPGVVHTIEWNGRNNSGQSVSSGVYFYKLVTKNFTQTKKMVLLK
jgi:hypothetical protein